MLSIDGVASQVSEGGFAAADSAATFDTFGRRTSMNYDVANGSTKKEEFSFDGEGREVYVYGRAKNGVRPQVHYTWANGELLGKNYEDGGVLYKWGGQVFHKGDTSARGIAAQGWGRKADFTETYDVTKRNGKTKEKHFSEAESAGVRYTRGLTGFQAGGSSYTVVSGDTLRGIAQKVYGHEGLWYLIADANGLNSDSDLTAGLQLGIPETRVTSNDSSTFKPYSPNALPIPQLEYKPPEQNMLVTAISVLVTIMVAIYTAGVASSALSTTFSGSIFGVSTASIAGAAVGGAAGSIAGQGVQIAGGNQSGFDWGQVGIGAIAGGLTGFAVGVGDGFGALGDLGENLFVDGAVNAGANVVGNQLITGHSGFRWSTIVASSIASGLTGSSPMKQLFGKVPGSWTQQLARNLAHSGIQEGVKQAMGDGGGFSLELALANAVGAATGGVLASQFGLEAKGKAHGDRIRDAFGNTKVNGTVPIQPPAGPSPALSGVDTGGWRVGPQYLHDPEAGGGAFDGAGVAPSGPSSTGTGVSLTAAPEDAARLDPMQVNARISRAEREALANQVESDRWTAIAMYRSQALRAINDRESDVQQRYARTKAAIAETYAMRDELQARGWEQADMNRTYGSGWDVATAIDPGAAEAMRAQLRAAARDGTSEWWNGHTDDIARQGYEAMQRGDGWGVFRNGLKQVGMAFLPQSNAEAALFIAGGPLGAEASRLVSPLARAVGNQVGKHAPQWAKTAYRTADNTHVVSPIYIDRMAAGQANLGLPIAFRRPFVANTRPLGGRGPATAWEGFDETLAGGPVRNFTNDRIRVTPRGIEVVEKHTGRFGPDEANDVMINRLRKIQQGEISATQQDLNFYSHELREYVRYRKLGWETGVPSNPDQARQLWLQTHSATLGDYNLPLKADELLYHPDALKKL